MEKSARKTRTRNFREIELLIWLLIVLALIVILFFIHSSRLKSFEIHNMFFSDVYGVIVGSPVNMMGVRIGYVNKLKMVNDNEIYVRFIVKDKSVHIPKGTIANIEFTGMGGSKSIELYPPNKEYIQMYGLDDTEYIVVQKPQRLSDCYALLYEMFSKIGSIIYRISYFSEQIKSSEIKNDTDKMKQNVNNFVEFYREWLDNNKNSLKIK